MLTTVYQGGADRVEAHVQLRVKRRILGHCRDYCTSAARLTSHSMEFEVNCTLFGDTDKGNCCDTDKELSGKPSGCDETPGLIVCE